MLNQNDDWGNEGRKDINQSVNKWDYWLSPKTCKSST